MAKRQAKSSIDHLTRLLPRTDISLRTQNEIMKRGYPEEQYKIPDDFRAGDAHGRLIRENVISAIDFIYLIRPPYLYPPNDPRHRDISSFDGTDSRPINCNSMGNS